MEHVVFFPSADGGPGCRRTADLAEALALVEQLLNVDGHTDVSVHALTEVPLTFRTVVEVEVAAPAAAVARVPAQAAGDDAVDPRAHDEPVHRLAGVPATSVGQRHVRRGDLGFFAS